mmetsp:Transcript_101480/g.262921  ORF Transcript_101480/g.262921 Transcript_101480/m.262921 type:complete len:327 (-) Transcript_101480:49-1029(-)
MSTWTPVKTVLETMAMALKALNTGVSVRRTRNGFGELGLSDTTTPGALFGVEASACTWRAGSRAWVMPGVSVRWSMGFMEVQGCSETSSISIFFTSSTPWTMATSVLIRTASSVSGGGFAGTAMSSAPTSRMSGGATGPRRPRSPSGIGIVPLAPAADAAPGPREGSTGRARSRARDESMAFNSATLSASNGLSQPSLSSQSMAAAPEPPPASTPASPSVFPATPRRSPTPRPAASSPDAAAGRGPAMRSTFSSRMSSVMATRWPSSCSRLLCSHWTVHSCSKLCCARTTSARAVSTPPTRARRSAEVGPMSSRRSGVGPQHAAPR